MHPEYLPPHQPALNVRERIWWRIRYDASANRWLALPSDLWDTVQRSTGTWTPRGRQRIGNFARHVCVDGGEEGLNSAMLAKTLPFLLLCACASTAELPKVDQPEFARMAQPYAQELQAVGITRVISPGRGAMVRLETGYGPVYVRYPVAAEPLAFVLDFGPDGLQAAAATFDRAKHGQIPAALLPEAVRVTAANNRVGWLRANPWN